MPEQPTKSNIEAKIAPVTEDYAETIANRKPGFTIIENGEEVTAISKAKFRELTDSKKSETRERQSGKTAENEEAAGIDEEVKLKRIEPKHEEKKVEPEVEIEIVEVDEEDYLKQVGVYNDKFIRTLADVDKEIEYRRKKLMELDGYEGNEALFSEYAIASPEDKIATLKSLRSVVGKVSDQRRIEREADKLSRSRGVPEKRESEPKKVVDLLDGQDKLLLDDPTPENIGKVLDKLVEIRVNEKMGDLDRKVGKVEFEVLKKEKGITPEIELELRNVLIQKPYLREVVSRLSVADTLDLLQTINKGSKTAAEIEQAKESGITEQRDRETKRKAQIRLRPGKATRISAEAEIEKDLYAKIAEARQARKGGQRVKVANIIADRLDAHLVLKINCAIMVCLIKETGHGHRPYLYKHADCGNESRILSRDISRPFLRQSRVDGFRPEDTVANARRHDR